MSSNEFDISTPQVAPAIAGIDEAKGMLSLRAAVRITLLAGALLSTSACVTDIAKGAGKLTLYGAGMMLDGASTALQESSLARQATFTALAPQLAALEQLDHVRTAVDVVDAAQQAGDMFHAAQDARQAVDTISGAAEVAEQARVASNIAATTTSTAHAANTTGPFRNIVSLTNQ